MNDYYGTGNVNVSAIVRNNGHLPINNFKLNYSLDNMVADSLSIVHNIPPDSTYEFTLTNAPLYFFETGLHHIDMVVERPNSSTDPNNSNDYASKKFSVLSYLPPKNVVVEDFVSANSPVSPAADTILNSVIKSYPGKVFGISYH